MMQCRDMDELLVEFLYQELDGAQAEDFRAHLDGCARCGAELKSLQQMRQALRSLPELEPSAAVTSRLLHEAGKRARPVEQNSGILAWLGKLMSPVVAHPAWAAVGTLVLVAGVAGVLTSTGRLDSSAPVAEVATSTSTTPGTKAEAPVTPTEDTFAAGAPASAPAEPTAAAAPPTPTVEGRDQAAAGPLGENKPDVRSPSKPEPPRDYASKVPAPAITAPARKTMRPGPGPGPGKVASGFEGGDADMKGLSTYDRQESDRQQRGGEKKRGAVADERNAEPVVADKQMPEDRPAATTSEAERGRVAQPKPSAPPPPPPSSVAPSGETVELAKEQSREPSKEQRPAATKSARESDDRAAGAAGAGSQGDSETAAAPREEAADETRAKAKKDAEEPPEQKLLRDAQRSASAGDCDGALTISRKIEKMNREFHRRRVAGDAALRACQADLERKNRAAGRRADDAQMEAPSAPSTAPSNKEVAK